MRTSSRQSGFSVVELLILLVVVGILGFVGYSVHGRLSGGSSTTASTTQTANPAKSTSSVAAAPAVNKTADLDKAVATLDSTDPSASNSADASQLNSDLAF